MNRERVFLLLLTGYLILTLPFQSIAGDKAMLGINHMIYVDVEKQNCEVELYINGIPVNRLPAKKPGAYKSESSEAAHSYLVDGINEIELLINPGPVPSQARTAQRELDTMGAYAVAKLVKYPADVYPGDPSGEVLATIQWQGQDAKKELFPKSVSTKVDLGPLFGRWQWQDAELVTLDKKTLGEISTYVEKFYAAFSASNGQEIQNLARIVRLKEVAKAFPEIDTAHEDKLFLRDVEERKQNKHWKVAPLRPALFDFRLCANGRMVEIVNSDWKPTIRGLFEDQDFEYTYQMFLSKIKGEWVMVR